MCRKRTLPDLPIQIFGYPSSPRQINDHHIGHNHAVLAERTEPTILLHLGIPLAERHNSLIT